MGTGQGYSVLQLLNTFERVTGTTVPYEIQERRQGDITAMYANASLADTELNWKTKYTLEQMCKFNIKFCFLAYHSGNVTNFNNSVVVRVIHPLPFCLLN